MSDRLRYLRLLYRLPLVVLHTLVSTPLTMLCQTAPGRAARLRGRALNEIVLNAWAAAT